MKTLFLFFLLVAGLRADITIANTSNSILTFGFCAPGANLNSVYQISFPGGHNYYTLTNPWISNYTDSYGVCNVCIFSGGSLVNVTSVTDPATIALGPGGSILSVTPVATDRSSIWLCFTCGLLFASFILRPLTS